MANTDKLLSYPSFISGLTVTAGTSWTFGSWVELTARTNQPISIFALQFRSTNVPAADTTYEQIFEIGIGLEGEEVTKIQIPSSFRADTAVSFYKEAEMFLPEPFYVGQGKRIAIRVANSVASAVAYNGVKIRYQIPNMPLVPAIDNRMINNYQFLVVGNGMSTSEKIK